jgi:hypothetical protein
MERWVCTGRTKLSSEQCPANQASAATGNGPNSMRRAYTNKVWTGQCNAAPKALFDGREA